MDEQKTVSTDQVQGFCDTLARYIKREEPQERLSQQTFALDVIFTLGKTLGYDNSASGCDEFLKWIAQESQHRSGQ